MQIKDRFYVYKHVVKEEFTIDNKTYPIGTIVYIGSGRGSRVYNKSGRRSIHKSVWDKLELLIIKGRLTYDEKIEEEAKLIEKLMPSGYLFNVRRTTGKLHELLYDELKVKYIIDENSPSGLSKIRPNRKPRPVGSKTSNGYWQTTFKDKNVKVHRIVYCLYNKVNLVESDLLVDHIDRNKSNNNPDNLRLATFQENCLNKAKRPSKPVIPNCLYPRKPKPKYEKPHRNNTTGHLGIQWIEPQMHYEVNRNINKKRYRKTFGVIRLMQRDKSLTFTEAQAIAFAKAKEYRDYIYSL